MTDLVSDLAEVFSSGSAVVVAGAGVSAATSGGAAPGWDGLLADAVQWCEDHVLGLPDDWKVVLESVLALGDISSLLAAAQMVTDKMGGREGGDYHKFLSDRFRDLSVVDREVPLAISELDVPIVTTNYDSLIEKAIGWGTATWLNIPRLQDIFRRREHVVVHLHGHWEEPRSVILGTRSYDDLLGHAGAQSLSRALGVYNSLVLIGVGEGANDPNWSAFRTWMRVALSGTAYPHYRLCRASELDRLMEEHGHREEPIKPVVYGDHFEELAPFLRELAPMPRGSKSSETSANATPRSPGRPQAATTNVKSAEVVVTVDQFGNADHVSIGEALQAAPAGARLDIRPGKYREKLLIDKPVTIAGRGGAPGDVQIVSDNGHTVQWIAAFGSISNVSLLQSTSGDWYGVNITDGQLIIDRCDIRSSALACIVIHGGADPIIRNTRLHDGKDVGIHVLPGGEGTVVDCEMREFKLDAVRIDGGSLAVRRTKIIDAGQYGVLLTNSGQGIFEDNDISHSSFANVAVTRGSGPVFRRNEIHNSSQHGVNVYDSGEGIFEDNKIYRNAYSNVEVTGGSTPTFRRNEIYLGWSGGVTITDGARGEYSHNQIHNNEYAGIFVDRGSKALLANNVIRDNGREGLVIAADGAGWLHHNEVGGNVNSQIVVADEARARVEQMGNREC